MTWNWFFSNRQKRKIGAALGVVLILIMLATWFVNYTIQQVDNQLNQFTRTGWYLHFLWQKFWSVIIRISYCWSNICKPDQQQNRIA